MTSLRWLCWAPSYSPQPKAHAVRCVDGKIEAQTLCRADLPPSGKLRIVSMATEAVDRCRICDDRMRSSGDRSNTPKKKKRPDIYRPRYTFTNHWEKLP